MIGPSGSQATCGDVCRFFITFANSLDPGPDLDPTYLTLCIYSRTEMLKR